jgi:hypothetical protein
VLASTQMRLNMYVLSLIWDYPCIRAGKCQRRLESARSLNCDNFDRISGAVGLCLLVAYMIISY